MVPLTSLWMPILLSAVLVFVVSSVIHMMLTYHRSDYMKVADEDKVRAALRPFRIPPGNYILPHATSMEAMKDPAFVEKLTAGPVAFMTIRPNGVPAMGGQLVQWFVYSVIVSAIAGYVAGRALGPGADYLSVFRFAGTTAFACYGMGAFTESIWMGRKWSTSIKHTFDGLIYGAVTAGAFGWLWP